MRQSRPRGRLPTISRERVFALDAEGWSPTEIARELGVRPSSISKIIGKRDREAEALQPVAPDADVVEFIRPPTIRARVVATPPVAPPSPIQPKAQDYPGSEWRGVALGQTLAERFAQLRVMHGAEVARDFARREAWHLTRTGVSVEAISQQFDLPTDEVEALVREARQRALDTIDKFDARLSLSAALEDIQVSRREALRVLNSGSASPGLRAQARNQLLRCAEAETDLAISIEAYRAAHGLNDDGSDTADMNRLDFWMSIPKRKGQER